MIDFVTANTQALIMFWLMLIAFGVLYMAFFRKDSSGKDKSKSR